MFLESPLPSQRIHLWILSLLAVWSCLAHAQAVEIVDYERGVKLVEEARLQRDRDRRGELLTDAEGAFQSFLKKNPEHDRVHSTHTHLGGIQVERARMRMIRRELASDDDRAEARRIYEESYAMFETAVAGIRPKLEELRVIDPSDRENIQRRDRIRQDYLQA